MTKKLFYLSTFICSFVTSISDPTNTSLFYLMFLHYCQSGVIQTFRIFWFVKLLLRFVQIQRENDAQQQDESRDGQCFVCSIAVVVGAAVYREGESTGGGQLLRHRTAWYAASVIICCWSILVFFFLRINEVKEFIELEINKGIIENYINTWWKFNS